MSDSSDFNDTNLTFTRYLYSKIEVKQSLLISILNKKLDESLFWLYELYYSGFQNELPGLLKNIYDEFFSIDNPKYQKIIEEKLLPQSEDKQKLNLGACVATFCMLEYRVHRFVELYYNVKCNSKSIIPSTKKRFNIHMKPSDIEKYQTVEISDPPRLYLNVVCAYPIHKSINSLFNVVGQDFKHIYTDMRKWIYYACRSPIWKERIEEYGGFIIDPLKQVVFVDENGDMDEDKESDFWDIWNLETDEQLPCVSEKSTGTNKEEQWTIIDFCRKYGAELATKKIKTNSNHA